jgi:putative colanic acid biosynthesis acetyltransferase WcaF
MSAEKISSRVKLADFNAAENYNRGAGGGKVIVWYLVKMCFFLTAFPFPSGFKSALLRLFGARVGKGLVIKPRVNIHMPWKLVIGDDVWIGEEAFLLNFEQLTIGSNVCISQRAFLCGGNHDFRVASMPYRNGPITLEDGSWIGAGCFVSPNAVVGTDSVVTACSTVVGVLPAGGIYGGNPAVFRKERWSK